MKRNPKRLLSWFVMLAMILTTVLYMPGTVAVASSLLASEGFNYSNGNLHNANGGSGWSGAWVVQNNNTSTPGYEIRNSSPLSYSTLQTSGGFAVGGRDYLTAGRGLNVNTSGPFAAYLSNGLIGASGKTLWMSFLIRKDDNTDQPSHVVLHRDNTVTYPNPPLVGAGYFGTSSNNGGIRYWTLRVGDSYFRTSVPVTVGQTALLVAKIDFGATNTVSLYVNPSSLGGSAPSNPSSSATTSMSIAFKSLAFYGGTGTNQSSIDEIRFGQSYGDVTPSSDTQAPTAPGNLRTTGKTSSSISLAWDQSTDNVAVTGYDVYRNNSKIATVASTSYTDSNLSAGTTYSYYVKAKDAAGNESAASSTINVTTDNISTGLPSGWSTEDIGNTSITGSALESGGEFVVKGSGADIWGTSDAFRYSYRTLSGDGYMVARVTSLQNTDPWAKAGIMVRNSLTAASQHVFACITPSNGVRTQFRSNDGGSSSDVNIGTGIAPVWVKLERTGNTFRTYRSNDGVNWGNALSTVTVSMNSNVYIGLAVTSHNNATLCETRFTNVSTGTSTPGDTQPPTTPTNLRSTGKTSNSVSLAWNASTDNVGVTGYDIYRNNSRVGTVAGTSYTDSGLVAANTYSYYVKAKDAAGNESPASSTIYVTTENPSSGGGKENNPLGTNLNSVNDWSTQIPFKNLIKMARWWNNTPNHGLTLDANGYPTKLNGNTAKLIYDRGSVPSLSDMTGNFLLLYDGEGNINISGSGITNVVKTPGRITYNNSQGKYFEIEITSINEANHIKNMRLVKDIYESNYESDPFVPNFINKIASKFNTLRFMDWQNTNNSTQQNWSSRTTPSYYSWSGSVNRNPVPVEIMVDLCNRTNSNAWFCMPHLATDDYMRQFATYVKNNLKPGLKVYLEFSNECWNWDFHQAQWCSSQGSAIGISAYQFYAKRAYEMFNIWSGVFGSEMSSRVVRVLGVQAGFGDAWQAKSVMDYRQADGNLTYTRADALAIAPYFSHGHSGIDNYAFYSPSTPVSTVLADCRANILDATSGKGVVKMIRNHMEAINARGHNDRGKKLDLISYEGGQHLSPYGQDDFTPLYTNANRDPGMGDLYTLYFNTWKAEGGKLFVNFSDIYQPIRWGMWGILEHQDQTSTPKYDAIMNFIQNNPKWW
jgi:chitodextrinase